MGESEGIMEQVIWLGDFNLHHPLWDEECNSHLFSRVNLEKSQVLIDALAEFDLKMVLPKDVPMLQALATGNHTRPDNIFISSQLVGSINKVCYTARREPSKVRPHPGGDSGRHTAGGMDGATMPQLQASG